MILPYKFYYKENNVLSIQYFRTLKQIKIFMENKSIVPFQINKREKGFYKLYSKFKVWAL
jgi:hypothetical protein